MSNSNNLIELNWRDRDYSDIEEIYVSDRSPLKKTKALLWYILLSIPLMLAGVGFIGIALLLAARKSKIARGVFYFYHSLFLIVPLAISALAVPGLLSDLPFMAKVPEGSFLAQFSIFEPYLAGMILVMIYFEVMLRFGQDVINRAIMDNNYSTLPKHEDELKGPQLIAKYKTFGLSGDLSDAQGKFTAENIEKGEDGENRTAELLDDLLKIPGTRIFHGIKWPGSLKADIDHIAINGEKVALIDSKMWSGKNHMLTSQTNVVTYKFTGESFIRKINFDKAVEKMRNELNRQGFSNLSCHGWIAVHNQKGSKVSTSNKHNSNNVLTLGDAKEVVDEIGQWFAENPKGRVHIQMIQEMNSRLK